MYPDVYTLLVRFEDDDVAFVAVKRESEREMASMVVCSSREARWRGARAVSSRQSSSSSQLSSARVVSDKAEQRRRNGRRRRRWTGGGEGDHAVGWSRGGVVVRAGKEGGSDGAGDESGGSGKSALDFLGKLFSSDTWMPKNSLRQQAYRSEEITALRRQVQRMEEEERAAAAAADAAESDEDEVQGDDEDSMTLLERSLLSDSDLSSSLLSRLVEMDREQQAREADEYEDIMAKGFNGEKLRELLRSRYRFDYDLQFVARELPGKRIFALNVMWKYLGLKSFPVTEEQYAAHLDSVAASLRATRQVSAVYEFIKRRKDKPRLGTAVSIPLKIDDDIVRVLFPPEGSE